jgi:thioredoxin-like negative regulator of GroEL
MTSPSFLMVLLAVCLPIKSTAFVTTSSHRSVPAFTAASITKPLQMSDATSDWYTPPAPPPVQAKLPGHAVPVITHINSPEAFQDYLQAPDDRITVVSFHAAWCKSCQKFGRLYQKLARDRADWVAGDTKKIKIKKADGDGDILEAGAIRLASIEWKANTELCRSLGVSRLPSVHYYQNGRKLAGFPAGPSKFQLVKDRLAYYETLSETELDFEATMEEGRMLVSETLALAAKEEEQFAAKERVTASAAAATPASSSSSLTSTATSKNTTGRYKSLWRNIFGRKTQP